MFENALKYGHNVPATWIVTKLWLWFEPMTFLSLHKTNLMHPALNRHTNMYTNMYYVGLYKKCFYSEIYLKQLIFF